MPIFEPGQVVRLPFPYIDQPTSKYRPGLVLKYFADRHFLWVAMITSARNAPWPEDVPMQDIAAAGLSKASVIRPTKITLVDDKAAEAIGICHPEDFAQTLSRIRAFLV
jgi:mRNA interferase MazF